MKMFLPALAFASTLAFAGTALAQEPAAAIGNQVGQVTVSTAGGDFRTAGPGQALRPGDRIMLVDGSAVTLNFPNGCAMNFTEPGVYTVPTVCTATVAATGTDVAGILALSGGVVAVAVGMETALDDVPAPPMSR